MNLNNLCTVAWFALTAKYYRNKKEYDKRKLVLDFHLLTDPKDEFDNNPFGIQMIVRSYKTNQTESYVYTKEVLENVEHAADVLIIPKIKSMIENVEKEKHYERVN